MTGIFTLLRLSRIFTVLLLLSGIIRLRLPGLILLLIITGLLIIILILLSVLVLLLILLLLILLRLQHIFIVQGILMLRIYF